MISIRVQANLLVDDLVPVGLDGLSLKVKVSVTRTKKTTRRDKSIWVR